MGKVALRLGRKVSSELWMCSCVLLIRLISVDILIDMSLTVNTEEL